MFGGGKNDSSENKSLLKFFPLCPVLKITTGLHDSAQQNAYSCGNRVSGPVS